MLALVHGSSTWVVVSFCLSLGGMSLGGVATTNKNISSSQGEPVVETSHGREGLLQAGRHADTSKSESATAWG
jgi:hypothetical protein